MYKLGIDLGGTNIVAGVVDKNFKIIATAKRKTNCPRKTSEILEDIAGVALDAVKNAGIDISEIEAAGIGAPGSIDPKKGEIIYSNNLGFNNVAVCDILKEKTGFDFYLENDANAAAWGEYLAGAGKGTQNFIMVTLGTGVGGGVIINGKIYAGFNYAGAELGHTVINTDGEACTCGRNGCFETYASATALIRQTKQEMIKHPDSIMWELTNGDINNVSGITAFDAMRKGDFAGKKVVENYTYYLGVGIANIMNIFQPEIICIGGGICAEGETLLAPVREFVSGENYARNSAQRSEIKKAQLGNDAGIIGAAYTCELYK